MIDYNVQGAKRKELVDAISRITREKAAYHPGRPEYRYVVGGYSIDCNGRVTMDESVTKEEARQLMYQLEGQGFHAEVTDELQDSGPAGQQETIESQTAEQPQEEPAPSPVKPFDVNLIIPKDGMDEAGMERLRCLVASKETLLKKALGLTDKLEVLENEQGIVFPWVRETSDPELVQSAARLVVRLARFAKKAKRVNGKDHEVENEKYSFRCFLLRLGFIGKEFKEDRKRLLKNLSGNAAFKEGGKDHETLAQG